MKKLLIILSLIICAPFFASCETSDTEIANALEGNMTRLVYSVGYLDSISVDELNSLVNGGSSYFTNSSLYNGSGVTDNLASDSNLDSANAPSENAISGGLETALAIDSLRGSQYRTRCYSSGASRASTQSVSADSASYYNGVVDLSLLETSASDLNDILLEISQRRGIIMLYCTDLRSGRATLTKEDKIALNEYIDIIKETTSFLNNNAGTLTNHYNNITSIATDENSLEIINARLIRANETLKTRYAKLDTCLDSLSAITNILVSRIGATYTDLYNSSLLGGGEGSIQQTPSDMEIIALDETANETTINNSQSSCEQICDNINSNNQSYLSEPNSAINYDNIINNTTNSYISENYGGGYGTKVNNYDEYNTSSQKSLSQNNYFCPSEEAKMYETQNLCNNCNGNLNPTANTTKYAQLEKDNTIINYNYGVSSNLSSNCSPSETCDGSCAYSAGAQIKPSISKSPSAPSLGINPSLSTNFNNSSASQSAIENNENSDNDIVISESQAKTQEEIILQGGLVKNNGLLSYNSDILPANLNLAKNEKSESRPLSSSSEPFDNAFKLKIVEPENNLSAPDSKQENSSSNSLITQAPLSPTHPDLSEPELTESEKELTPDLLPFIGETTNEPRPIPFSPELGLISLNPITFQEESPLMLLPRK